MIEREIEAKVVEWWGPHRFQLKLNVMGRRGWPDRLFLTSGPRAVFIEFKRPGEKPRPLQEYIHRKLREMGFETYVCDNVDDAKARLERPPVSSPECKVTDFDGLWGSLTGSRPWEDRNKPEVLPDPQGKGHLQSDAGGSSPTASDDNVARRDPQVG